jgi:hypothetical protein
MNRYFVIAAFLFAISAKYNKKWTTAEIPFIWYEIYFHH